MEKTQLTGRIVTPDDPDYEMARTNNNLSFPKFPKILVFCRNVGDVVNALKWVQENRVPFRIRSGRHSYENFSLVTGGLVIDISEMNAITYDQENMTVKIEAGANLGLVYPRLWEHRSTIPAGTEKGEFVGTASSLRALVRPLTDIGSPTKIVVKEVPYIKAVRFFDEPSGNLPAHRKRSGSFLKRPFPAEAIKTMKHFLENAPNENAAVWNQALGGATRQISPSETAFYYRNAIIAQEYKSTWSHSTEEPQNIRWIEELRKALSKYTNGDYVNWPDRLIKDWPTTYYGKNLKRLQAIKKAYDPSNLFRFPQSIPLPSDHNKR